MPRHTRPTPNESFENYFGLWYADYPTKGLKPAGRYYRDNFPVRRFPTLNDTTPPGPVASLAATVSASQVHLTWTAPSDLDFTGTMIRFSTGVYPTSPSDGQLLLDMSSLPSATVSCDHTGLQPGVTCYYALFAYDTSRNYAGAARIAATPPLPQDLDRDGDVDLDDFGLLQRCLSGRAIPQPDPACAGRDYSPDGAVDINDLRIFFRCLSGPNVPPTPSCAE